MSDYAAIATVTRALQQILEEDKDSLADVHPDPLHPGLTLNNIAVTGGPPEGARQNKINQVNLFLYHLTPNAAWRNLALPLPPKGDEQGGVPLPLNLTYLISAYGADDNDLAAQQLLGWAMRRLQDFPVLAPQVIAQLERVRITLQPLSLDDLSKLWLVLKATFSLSVAYQVDVVLIESTRSPRAPLPVLTRGKDDSGVASQPGLVPAYPTIEALEAQAPSPPGGPPAPTVAVPDKQPGIALGQTLILRGHHLDGRSGEIQPVTRSVRFRRLRDQDGFEVPPDNVTAARVTATLQDPPAVGVDWVAGIYTVSLVYRDAAGNEVQTSNEFPLAVVPSVLPLGPPIPVVRDNQARLILSVSCTPAVQPGQSVLLLLGGPAIPADPLQAAAPVVDFDVTDVPPGDYYIRLRVDGVDSLLVKDYAARPPKFDEAQKVTIP